MCILPTDEKYVIFLHNRYFKKSPLKSIYNKIKKKLENKGISVFNIKTAIPELQKNKNNKLSFDDTPFPNSNMLYINLFNGHYYNDSIYNKKKLDIEREMLILLAATLGVKDIRYETNITEITITKLSANATIKGLKNGINYEKKINTKDKITGSESYLNRGAPVYLKSKTISNVEESIRSNLDSIKSVFNYNFYKSNSKLESFVFKRYEFKMLKLDYEIETEDISDISFLVKSLFIDYGINISFENTTSYNQRIKYVLEFFSDKELKTEYFNAKRPDIDEFYSIREQYDCSIDKENAISYITEYVMQLAKKCYYTIIGGCGRKYDYSAKLNQFIKLNDYSTFQLICSDFRSTLQIKNWIYKFLSEPGFEIVSDDNNIFINRHNLNKYGSVKRDDVVHEIHNFASPYSRAREQEPTQLNYGYERRGSSTQENNNVIQEMHNFATPYSKAREQETNQLNRGFSARRSSVQENNPIKEIHNFTSPSSRIQYNNSHNDISDNLSTDKLVNSLQDSPVNSLRGSPVNSLRGSPVNSLRGSPINSPSGTPINSRRGSPVNLHNDTAVATCINEQDNLDNNIPVNSCIITPDNSRSPSPTNNANNNCESSTDDKPNQLSQKKVINSYENNETDILNSIQEYTELSKSTNSLDNISSEEKRMSEHILELESQKNTLLSFLAITNNEINELSVLIEEKKILVTNQNVELTYLKSELHKSYNLLENFEKDKLDYENRHKKIKTKDSSFDKINGNITLEKFKINEFNVTINKKELLVKQTNDDLLLLMENYDTKILTKNRYFENLSMLDDDIMYINKRLCSLSESQHKSDSKNKNEGTNKINGTYV